MNNIFTLMQGNQEKKGLDTLVTALAGVVSRNASANQKESTRGLTMGLESLSMADNSGVVNDLSATLTSLQGLIGTAITESGINLNVMGMESIQNTAGVGPQLSDISTMSAGVVAAAMADPMSYIEFANRVHSTPAKHTALTVATEGLGGTVAHAPAMGLENFTEQSLRSMAGWSIVLAATGAKQDDFCEAFFKYILVGAGDMGLTLTLARAQIVNAPHHDQTGDPNDFARVNLIDAARNPDLLNDESTRIFPVVHQDPAHPSRKYLVPGAASREVKVDQNTFNTAPLKFGEVGLINISTPDYLVVQGVMELTDVIGVGGRIQEVILKVGNDLIPLKVRELTGFGFLPAPEGRDVRQVLNATTKSIMLTPTTRNDRGALPDSLKVLRDNNLQVRLTVTVNGELDLGTSIAYVDGKVRSVSSISTVEGGVDVPTDAGVGLEVLELMQGSSLEGWYPDMVRSNENGRVLGKLFDTTEERFAYGIPLTSPFSVLAPTGSNAPAKNLETLIAAQRRRQHAAGVSTLLNHLSDVEATYAAKLAGLEVAEIGSVGARITHPYFKRIYIDAKKTQSLRDNDKALDLAAKITNTIRYHAAEMAVETGYTAALEASVRGSKKLRLLVGTSIPLMQQLMVTGDLRTFGPMFDEPIVVATLNKKMDNKIVVSFTRDSEPNHPDELAFGYCAGLPELVTVIDTRRGGSQRKEATTQGRYLYIPNLPFGFIVEVQNLKDGLIDPSIYHVDGLVLKEDSSAPAGGFPIDGSGGTPTPDAVDPNAGNGN